MKSATRGPRKRTKYHVKEGTKVRYILDLEYPNETLVGPICEETFSQSELIGVCFINDKDGWVFADGEGAVIINDENVEITS